MHALKFVWVRACLCAFVRAFVRACVHVWVHLYVEYYYYYYYRYCYYYYLLYVSPRYLFCFHYSTTLDGYRRETSRQSHPVLYYRQYEYAGNEDQNVAEKDLHVTARADRDVRDFAGETGFKTSFVMVVTWEKAVLWPARRPFNVRYPA